MAFSRGLAAGTAIIGLLVAAGLATRYLEPGEGRGPAPAARDGSEAETIRRLRLELEEARLVARTLAEENAALRRAAGGGPGPGPGWVPTVPARTPGPAPERPAAPVELSVVDVNEDLDTVVLDGGQDRGLAPGMEFDVIRGGRVVARVKAEEVRGSLTGARMVVELVADGYPQVGDRARRRADND